MCYVLCQVPYRGDSRLKINVWTACPEFVTNWRSLVYGSQYTEMSPVTRVQMNQREKGSVGINGRKLSYFYKYHKRNRHCPVAERLQISTDQQRVEKTWPQYRLLKKYHQVTRITPATGLGKSCDQTGRICLVEFSATWEAAYYKTYQKS